MSRYSQNVPSQCCSRKFEVSSLRSTIEIKGLVLVVAILLSPQYAARRTTLTNSRHARGRNVRVPTNRSVKDDLAREVDPCRQSRILCGIPAHAPRRVGRLSRKNAAQLLA